MVELAEQRRLAGLALRIPGHQHLDRDRVAAPARHGAPDLSRAAPAEQRLERVAGDDGRLAGRRFRERQGIGHVGDRRTTGGQPVPVVHRPPLVGPGRGGGRTRTVTHETSGRPARSGATDLTRPGVGAPDPAIGCLTSGDATAPHPTSVPSSPICGRDRARYLHLVAAARATSLQPSTEQQIADIVRVTVDDEVDTGTFRAIVADVTTTVLR